MFKTMDGNRLLKNDRVNKIVESINAVGYILSPILVNEKMEVIDGQGRLAALERLKMPVHYMVPRPRLRLFSFHSPRWMTSCPLKVHAFLWKRPVPWDVRPCFTNMKGLELGTESGGWGSRLIDFFLNWRKPF